MGDWEDTGTCKGATVGVDIDTGAIDGTDKGGAGDSVGATTGDAGAVEGEIGETGANEGCEKAAGVAVGLVTGAAGATEGVDNDDTGAVDGF